MQRPLYMRPQDALEYGIIDEVIQPNAMKQQKAVEYWVKSGRAESEGRLEQWAEYLALQEEYALKDSFKKVVGQVRGGWVVASPAGSSTCCSIRALLSGRSCDEARGQRGVAAGIATLSLQCIQQSMGWRGRRMNFDRPR